MNPSADFSRICIDSVNYFACRGDVRLRLRGYEFVVFRELWKARGKLVSAEKLVFACQNARQDWYDGTHDVSVEVLKTVIHRLRKKVPPLGVFIPSGIWAYFNDQNGYHLEFIYPVQPMFLIDHEISVGDEYAVHRHFDHELWKTIGHPHADDFNRDHEIRVDAF